MVSSPDDNRERALSQNSTSPPHSDEAISRSQACRNTRTENNPFIVLREYANEHISSLLQSVMGLPSIFASPDSNQWSTLEQQAARFRKGWTPNSHDSSDTEEGRWSSAETAAGSAKQSPSDYDEFYDRKRKDPWRRRRDWENRSFDSDFESFMGGRLPFFSLGHLHAFPLLFSDPFAVGFGDDIQGWAIPYILFSPYSPLHLEQSSQRRRGYDGIFSTLFSTMRSSNQATDVDDNFELRWRDAFEDLLRLENGKPILCKLSDPTAVTKRNTENGNEWLRGLIQRGSLGDNWKQVAKPNERSPCTIAFEKQSENRDSLEQSWLFSSNDDSDTGSHEKAATELDLYDRFLSDITTPRESDHARGLFDSPLMRLLFDEKERRRHRERWEEQQRLWKEQPEIQPEEENRSDKHETEEAHYMLKGEVSRLSASPRESSDDIYRPLSSSIISTITRTERTQRPDGSVETKTVNVQRFADGREESNESVEVVRPQEQRNQTTAVPNLEPGNKRPQEPTIKVGWFWSR